ncbi:unnamed protein product [marine sediment metagenome]|uniref:PD-(D/E)XK endonuclease-like domain-containing protein n=1 Tax=marine sediment metagenome TaxID=412755 RepID=X1AFX6_9ZZZZ
MKKLKVDLETFKTCTLKYKFNYIDKIKREEEGIEAFSFPTSCLYYLIFYVGQITDNRNIFNGLILAVSYLL